MKGRFAVSVIVAMVLLAAAMPGAAPHAGAAASSPSAQPLDTGQAVEEPTEGPPTIEATDTRVIDGTTLDAYVAGRRTALGYLGAEAAAANQPCGREALARNRELAGARVLLREDAAYQFDELGRRLYYASTPEGLSIEEALVTEGLARAVRTDAVQGTRLAELQAEAEAAGRGCLWSGISGGG